MLGSDPCVRNPASLTKKYISDNNCKFEYIPITNKDDSRCSLEDLNEEEKKACGKNSENDIKNIYANSSNLNNNPSNLNNNSSNLINNSFGTNKVLILFFGLFLFGIFILYLFSNKID
jgi:hypothetical protein